MKENELGTVEEARDPVRVAQPSANDQPLIKNARGITGKESLPGRVNAAPEKAPLSAVGMPRKDQIDRQIPQIRFIVFGMVR